MNEEQLISIAIQIGVMVFGFGILYQKVDIFSKVMIKFQDEPDTNGKTVAVLKDRIDRIELEVGELRRFKQENANQIQIVEGLKDRLESLEDQLREIRTT